LHDSFILNKYTVPKLVSNNIYIQLSVYKTYK